MCIDHKVVIFGTLIYIHLTINAHSIRGSEVMDGPHPAVIIRYGKRDPRRGPRFVMNLVSYGGARWCVLTLFQLDFDDVG